MNRLLVALLTGSLLLSQAALAGKRHTDPPFVEDALAYVLTDRTKAIQLLEDAIEHGEGVDEDDIPLVMVHAGEQRRLAGSADLAHDWFAKALAQGERGFVNEAARIGLALVDAASGMDSNTRRILEDVKEKEALPTQNADRYLVLAVAAHLEGDRAAEREFSRKALTYAKEDPQVHERVSANLEALEAVETTDEPTEGTPSPIFAPMSEVDRADKALEDGDADEAKRLALKILSASPSPEDEAFAQYLLKRVEAPPVRPERIGVLLPLAGKYEAIGRMVRESFEYGYSQGGGTAELVYADSGGTPESAVAALESLVLDQGVISVVGPLLTDTAESVASAAQALRVPLIGLSQGLEPGADQDYVFQAMLTPRDQIEALLDRVMGIEGMTAFAVFAPDNNYGHNATEVFQEEVAERGGEVTIVEFFDPAATDLIPHAKTLGRKDYEARSWEFRKLRDEAEEKGGDPSRVVLPPTLDFQALFIPDNASRVPIACAALAYEEFPMGDFQTDKDADILPLLGLSGWNNSSLVTQGGPYVRGSYFTDAFLPEDPASAPFIEAFRAEMGRTPTPLEAITVDAGRLVAAASAEKHPSRSILRDALIGLETTDTVTGASSFSPEDRSVVRRMRILTITKDAIEAREPPPAPIEGEGAGENAPIEGTPGEGAAPGPG